MNAAFNPQHPVPCVYLKHGAYWLVKRGKWERIGATLEEALAEYGRRAQTPKGGMAALIEQVYAHHTPALAKATRDCYRTAANTLSRKLAAFAPEQVKGKHVAAIKLSMAEHKVTANHALTFLRTVFTYAVEWQLVATNPCIGIKPYRTPKRDRYLTDGEYGAIKAAAGARLGVIMDLCYLTGQRISDVLSIHARDIVDAGVRFKAQKTGVQFTVGWTDDLRAAVEAAKALQKGPRTLHLLSARGARPLTYSTVRQQWDDACTAAGVDANIHDIRAKAATDAKAQGFDAQALLGHASAQMTARYIRLRESPIVRGPTMPRRSES